MSNNNTSDDNAINNDNDEDAQRRADEWDALQAVYQGDKGISLFCDDKQTTTTTAAAAAAAAAVWTIQLHRTRLSFTLPASYPSRQAPVDVSVYAPHVATQRLVEIKDELMSLWTADTEVALVWTEHVRQAVEQEENDDDATNDKSTTKKEDANNNNKTTGGTTLTFVPPTAKFGQPMRTFDANIVLNDAHRVPIFCGQPFRPPKSGPAELLQAYCATVTSAEQVQWVWAELLLNHPKVAKASHNMVAYRYSNSSSSSSNTNNSNSIVSDNDDDGEKGAGAKLAALLQLADLCNVMVVVARWYGGIHLGPARFKWIAATAREALQQGGFY